MDGSNGSQATAAKTTRRRPRAFGLASIPQFCSGFPSSPAIHGRKEDFAAPSVARRERRDQRKNHALTAPPVAPSARDKKIKRRVKTRRFIFSPQNFRATFLFHDHKFPRLFFWCPLKYQLNIFRAKNPGEGLAENRAGAESRPPPSPFAPPGEFAPRVDMTKILVNADPIRPCFFGQCRNLKRSIFAVGVNVSRPPI